MAVQGGLSLLLWNARSLVRKTQDFKITLKDLHPTIVGVCETWLRPSLDIRFRGYTVSRTDRPGRVGGGLLIAVRNTLPFTPLPLTTYAGGHLEVKAIKVALNTGWAGLMIMYNPCKDISEEEFKHYFHQLPIPSLIMGDFNARHALWDPSLPTLSENTSGSNLFQTLLSSPRFCLLSPPGLKTRYNPVNAAASNLDLFIGDSSFLGANYKVGPYMASDHLPIIATFPTLQPRDSSECRPRWKLCNNKWDTFTALVSDQLPSESSILDLAAGSFSNCLESAGKNVFIITKMRSTTRSGAPWWTEECARTRRASRKAFHAWSRRPSVAHWISFRRCDAIKARTILQAKRTAWSNHCSKQSFTNNTAETWRFFQSMSGRPTHHSFPLTRDGVTLLDDSSKAEVLASFFQDQLSAPHPLPRYQALQYEVTQSTLKPAPSYLSQPFTDDELSTGLRQLVKGRAVGPDMVANEFLLHLPSTAREQLLNIFNRSWTDGHFPTPWKESILIPIPKPGRNPAEPSSYRPIALLSNVGKLLERLVTNRLSWWIEDQSTLMEEQCGFRTGRGTQDILCQLEHHIHSAYKNHQVMLALFIDLKGAFDSASHLGILWKLQKRGFTGNPLAWVKDFLEGRSFRVSVGGSLSSPTITSRGVPQGSPESPLLFNVLLSDLPRTRHTNTLAYADDLTVICHGTTLQEAQERLQVAATELEAWVEEWGLTISTPKSAVMTFTLKKLTIPPSIHLRGGTIPAVRHHKVLGLIFDGPILTWQKHITHLQKSCMKNLNIMKCVAGTRWGANRDTLLQYYRATILAKLSYGSSVYSSASNTQLKKLDVIQNSALRIALGAFRSSPTMSLHAESGLLPLSDRRNLQLCRRYSKIMTLPQTHPLARLYQASGVSPDNISWPVRSRKPLQVRALHTYQQLNLPPPPTPAPTPLHPPIAPWNSPPQFINTDFHPSFNKSSDGHAAPHLFQEMNSKTYANHTKIYTDGSHTSTPPSTASAVYFADFPLRQAWRIDHRHTSLDAELFAILQALIFIRTHLSPQRAVIYTDSKSSLLLLLSRKPSTARTLLYNIHELMRFLTGPGWEVRLQWVPSHVGIQGNEIADATARLALQAPVLEYHPIQASTLHLLLSRACRQKWDDRLSVYLPHTSLGMYRTDSSSQPWVRARTRVLDTALTKLRIGHVGLNAHLHRLRLVDSPRCKWCLYQDETIKHYLLECYRHFSARTHLRSRLTSLGIRNFDLPTLLSARGVAPHLQPTVIRLTCTYLRETGQLTRL